MIRVFPKRKCYMDNYIRREKKQSAEPSYCKYINAEKFQRKTAKN